jgi:hypothetical protein
MAAFDIDLESRKNSGFCPETRFLEEIQALFPDSQGFWLAETKRKALDPAEGLNH